MNSKSNSDSNSLLKKIIKYLNGKNISFDRIHQLIEDSTTEQLIPAFAFLGFWITSASSGNGAEQPNIENAFFILDIILQKVPPLNLLTGTWSLNWGMFKPSKLLHDLYRPVTNRIRRISFYIQPFHFDPSFISWSPTFDIETPSLPGISNSIFRTHFETEYQLSYISSFKNFIKRLEIVDGFQNILSAKNARAVFTNSIIMMLEDLRDCSKASHIELLYSYSCIFIYIHSFLMSNSINGQIICDYIKSMPYSSPFLLFAISNYIQPNLYLYSQLIPKKLTKGALSRQEVMDAIAEQYPMYDSSQDHTLDEFIKTIPEILYHYFQPSIITSVPENVTEEKLLTSSQRLSFFNMKNVNIKTKFKCIMKYKEYIPNNWEIAGINQLSQYFIRMIQPYFVHLVQNNLFDQNILHLFLRIMNFHLPAYGKKFLQKFFVPSVISSDFANPFLRLIVKYGWVIFRSSKFGSTFIEFLFNCFHLDRETAFCSRIVIEKLLQCFDLIINENICDLILKCEDIIIMLDCIDAFDNFSTCKSSIERDKVNLFREKLINILPFNYISKYPYIISGPKTGQINQGEPNVFNKSSNEIKEMFFTFINSPKSELIKDNFLLLRLLSSTQYIFRDDSAKIILAEIERGFKINSLFPSLRKDFFSLSYPDIYYPLAQIMMRKFIQHKMWNFAIQLANDMLPFCLDNPRLLWLVNLLSEFSLEMPDTLKSVFLLFLEAKVTPSDFNEILLKIGSINSEANDSSTSNISETVLSSFDSNGIGEVNCTKPDNFFLIDTLEILLEYLYEHNESSLIRPDDDLEEIRSQLQRSISMSVIFILLKNQYSGNNLAEILIKPIVDSGPKWKNRNEKCNLLNMMVILMPKEVGYAFFKALLNAPRNNMVIDIGKTFLGYSKIDVLEEICTSAKQLIDYNNQKLEAFMRTALTQFFRLNQEVASKMICGILESVQDITPKWLMEDVLDAVELIYLSLQLQRFRGQFINAARKFPPDLKTLFASNLNVKGNEKKTQDRP